MNILNCFGIGVDDIISKNIFTEGIVTEVKTCWWLKVNKKPIRTSASDGAVFPHIICFTYKVNGKEYTGRLFADWNVRCPAKSEFITVYYDKDAPEKYAVKL